MKHGPVLGIDLGTTNSVVAVADGGEVRVLTDALGRRTMPSVVSFPADGPPLVGYEARERRLVDAKNTVYAVKRLIGRPYESPEVARARERFAFEIVPNKHGGTVVKVQRGTYALAEISAMVLRELRRRAEDALGESAERAVITVPANFNELQRSATKAAGKVAGLDVLRILNEPTAAALAYGYTAGESERVAVYDLGGGTFDITILELEDDVFEVLSTAGDTFLGGEDLDRALAEVMCDRFSDEHGIDLRRDPQAFERVKAAAEWAKCRLSNEEEIELTVEEIARAGGRVLDLAFAMTRAELEALATPWLDRSFAVCTKALASAGLRVHEIDRVVLVGGSTRMPLCRRRVAEFFGKAPRTDLDPDLVVAQGAAIHGFALGGPREPRPLRTAPVRPRIAGRPTRVGVPRQPAFAPEEQGILVPRPARRPARSTRPPPPMPELPPPARSSGAVLVTRAVEVRTPKSTIDAVLDELVPPDGDDSSALDELVPPDDETRALDELVPPDEHAAGALDDLAPPDDGGAGVLDDLAPPDDGGAGALELALSESAALGGDDLDDRDHLALSNDLDALAPPAELDDLAPTPFAPAGTPFGLAPDDPFAPPDPGARAPRAPEPELSSPPRPARPRGQKRVPSREPTAKLSIDLRPPARPHPPVPAAKRPPPPPPPPAPPARPPRPRPAPPAPPPPVASRPVSVPDATASEPRASFVDAIAALDLARSSEPPPITIGVPSTPARDPVQSFVLGAAPVRPIVSMPDRPPPLLMDVTPHSLGLATAGGYCRRIIAKNAPVPTEQMRTFTTAQDDQREVVIRICQGEDERFENNEVLGEIVLDQLPPRRRGETRIEVSFILDADGTLAVEARDAESGRAARTRIALRGGLSAEEIEAMRRRQAEELP